MDTVLALEEPRATGGEYLTAVSTQREQGWMYPAGLGWREARSSQGQKRHQAHLW